MSGAHSLMRTLADGGVELCLANPGTTEMHLVAALESEPRLRAVLGLFEGVVSGAADGYARMAEKPAAGLFHLGPGFANAIANLHNARRAASPVLALIGEHATYHQICDAPLASDIDGLAGAVSAWVKRCRSADELALAGAQALAAACAPPGQIASLIVPADAAWQPANGTAEILPPPQPAKVPPARVEAAAARLKKGKAALLLRGKVLQEDGLQLAGRIAAATGCRLLVDTFAPRLARGAGRVRVERLPYFPEQLAESLQSLRHLLLVGGEAPVAFFAYQGKPSHPLPTACAVARLAHPAEDGVAALRALAEQLGAPPAPHAKQCSVYDAPPKARGALTADLCAPALVRHLPDGAIVSDEAATSGLALNLALESARPHEHLALTGGAIGQGLPLSVGAALACPDRKIVCLHGDGGAMYTLQSLWTQAREKLDVTTVIFSNRAYAILSIEMHRTGEQGGAKTASLFDLANPELRWTQLAEGMGVAASRAETAEEFDAQFAAAMRTRGPHLIEAVLPGGVRIPPSLKAISAQSEKVRLSKRRVLPSRTAASATSRAPRARGGAANVSAQRIAT